MYKVLNYLCTIHVPLLRFNNVIIFEQVFVWPLFVYLNKRNLKALKFEVCGMTIHFNAVDRNTYILY